MPLVDSGTISVPFSPIYENATALLAFLLLLPFRGVTVFLIKAF